MPDDFVANDDYEAILRPKKKILEAIKSNGLGATPNEIAAGVVTPDEVNAAEAEYQQRLGQTPSGVPTHQVVTPAKPS